MAGWLVLLRSANLDHSVLLGCCALVLVPLLGGGGCCCLLS